MPNFLSLITLCSADHFDVMLFPRFVDACPFMFNVARRIFALGFFLGLGIFLLDIVFLLWCCLVWHFWESTFNLLNCVIRGSPSGMKTPSSATYEAHTRAGKKPVRIIVRIRACDSQGTALILTTIGK